MFDFFWNLFAFIILLGTLVTGHEYGHFWVARRCGVKVERFSVGFGKTLWRWFDKQGTEYVIALIPLGGYVKMLDERVDNVSAADKDKAFNNKSVYQRIAIIAAGPLANFIIAIFAFYLMFLIGVPSVKPIIGNVTANSIVAQVDIKQNSEIISINDNTTTTWQDVNMALVAAIGEKNIDFKVKLPQSQFTKNYVLNAQQWNFSPDKESAITSLGILPFRPKTYTELAFIAKDSPAQQSGLKAGDKLISLANLEINDNWQIFSDKIKQYADKSVSLTVLRAGKLINLTVKPASREINGKKVGYLGVSPKQDKYPQQYRIEQSYGVLGSFSHALDKTWQLVSLSFDMIGKLVTGHISINNLSGPIAIAQGFNEKRQISFTNTTNFVPKLVKPLL